MHTWNMALHYLPVEKIHRLVVGMLLYDFKADMT